MAEMQKQKLIGKVLRLRRVKTNTASRDTGKPTVDCGGIGSLGDAFGELVKIFVNAHGRLFELQRQLRHDQRIHVSRHPDPAEQAEADPAGY
jgi:hypothetical protein